MAMTHLKHWFPEDVIGLQQTHRVFYLFERRDLIWRESWMIPHRVFVPFLLRIVRLPAACGEDVFVLLVPAPQYHFTCMRLQKKEHNWLNFDMVFKWGHSCQTHCYGRTHQNVSAGIFFLQTGSLDCHVIYLFRLMLGFQNRAFQWGAMQLSLYQNIIWYMAWNNNDLGFFLSYKEVICLKRE